MAITEEFKDKLKYVEIKRITCSDPYVKDSLLRVLMSFMIFEYEFFESPIYIPDDDSIEKERVIDRLIKIQDFFNSENINLLELPWFIKFQNYFYKVYFMNTDGMERFWEMEFDSENNLEGIKHKYMDNLYHFLECSELNRISHQKYFNKNSRYAIKHALELCYVFRNNICHGKKGLDELVDGTYRQDFNEISDFLIGLMSFLREKCEKKF